LEERCVSNRIDNIALPMSYSIENQWNKQRLSYIWTHWRMA